MSEWIDIAALCDVPVRGARVVKTHAGCVAVFRTASDQVFALDNACPHKAGLQRDQTGHLHRPHPQPRA